MYLFNIFINFVRAVLIILLICHICKRQYKMVISTAVVFILTFLLYVMSIFDIKPDLTGSCLYIIIIVMTVYLGNSFKFYDKYFWWDLLIHFLSGIVFVSFAIALSKKAGNLEKLHILFFGFTYSLSHHALWEVLEYLSDCIFHTNNQRWQKVSDSINHKPESAIQPAGLVDTMNDIISCIAGTLIACAAWWFML